MSTAWSNDAPPEWVMQFLRPTERFSRFRKCETIELPQFPQQLCDQELPAKGQE